jgi:pyruvate dehydrogenase E2 component (dihydrolipoamide acetyltransferase)
MDVRLPKLGEGSESGTVVGIMVKEGDVIARDQTILELENEKAVAPIPSPVAGKVTGVRVKEGDKLSVGQVILTITEEAGAGQGSPKSNIQSPKSGARRAEAEAKDESEPAGPSAEEEEPASPEPEGAPGGVPAAAPSVRKIARELGIDLTQVRGSERGGRIVFADLRAYIQRLQRLAAQPKAAPGQKPAVARAEQIDFAKWGAVTRKPLSPLRKVISERMVENWTAIPHVTQFDEADITVLTELRKKHAPAYEQKGARLTLTSFVLKAVVATLKKHPIFNTSLDEATGEIVFKEYYHIGLAVDTEQGLIVPVIRDVDKKSMLDLSKEITELAEKARGRKVSLDELKGGTFTISNQGGIGGAHFTPIINKPEVAILGLGRGAMKPVVRNEKVDTRLLLPLGLSYDHRVIDGANAARFIVDLVQALENWNEGEME